MAMRGVRREASCRRRTYKHIYWSECRHFTHKASFIQKMQFKRFALKVLSEGEERCHKQSLVFMTVQHFWTCRCDLLCYHGNHRNHRKPRRWFDCIWARWITHLLNSRQETDRWRQTTFQFVKGKIVNNSTSQHFHWSNSYCLLSSLFPLFIYDSIAIRTPPPHLHQPHELIDGLLLSWKLLF